MSQKHICTQITINNELDKKLQFDSQHTISHYLTKQKEK